MRIGVVATDLQRIDARTATSDHASTRLRALIPAAALARRGHRLLLCSDRDLYEGAVDDHLPELDVLVVHKVRLDLAARLDLARAAGVAVVVDLCDHVFLHPVLSAFYPAMLARADVVTAATPAMAEVAMTHLDRPVRVIADALEGRRGDPAAVDPAAQPQLLWFGRMQNAEALVAALPSLAQAGAARLEIVTNADDAFAARVAATAPDRLSVRLTPWTPAAVEAGLAACDLVVLPTDRGPALQVKSANRLERAIWGGRPVVARPTAVTRPWADVAFLDEDLSAGLTRALAARASWPQRIREAQEQLLRTRTGDALAPAWEDAAEVASEARHDGGKSSSALGTPPAPV